MKNRRWIRFAAGGIVLVFLGLVVGLTFTPADSRPVLTFGVDGTKKGSNAGGWEFVIYDPTTGLPDNFIALASITNNGRLALQLGSPSVRWDISNYPPSIEETTWGGAGAPTLAPVATTGPLVFPASSLRIPPRGVAQLPIGPPLPGYPPHPEYVLQRCRFEFDYSADAGGVRRRVSYIVRKVPKKLLPQYLADWLFRNGFVDGQLHGHFESDWQPYPFAASG